MDSIEDAAQDAIEDAVEDAHEDAAQRTEALARAAVPLLRATRPPPPQVKMPPVGADQVARAQDTLALLHEVIPATRDETTVARLFLEVGAVLGFPLGERRVALESIRQAHRRWRAPHLVRAYRKAALRADQLEEALIALEAEIELASDPSAQSSLHVARAEVLERLEEAPAARAAFTEALNYQENHLGALEGLERLATDDRDAARWARAQSQSTSDPSVSAEHAARAAMFLLRLDDPEAVAEARELARKARLHAPSSPTVLRALEDALARHAVDAELPALREAQLIQGAVPAQAGWLDLAIVARYRLDDIARARKALSNLLETRDLQDGLRLFALTELSELLLAAGEMSEVARLEVERIPLLGAGTPRAAAYDRLARIYAGPLSDPVRAAASFRDALREDGGYAAAIRGAQRLAHRQGDFQRLEELRLHEARSASDSSHRALAQLDAGTILAADPKTRAEGIRLLREAYEAIPKHLGPFLALQDALRSAGDHESLLALYRSEVERTDDPTRHATLLQRIACLAADHLSDDETALEAWSQAATLQSGDAAEPESLVRLAELQIRLGKHKELIETLEQIANRSVDPERMASWLERLAAAQLELGDLKTAITTFRRAFVLASPDHPVFRSAERAFWLHAEDDELLGLLQSCSEQSEGQTRADALVMTAEVHAAKGEVDAAIEALEAVLDVRPTRRDARELLTHLLRRRKDWGRLRTTLTPPDNAVDALRAAAVAEASGDDAAARSGYEEVERLGLRSASLPAARAGGRRTSSPPETEGLWTHLAQRFDRDDDVAEQSLAWLIKRTIDASLKSHLAGQRARRLDRLGRADEALELRHIALEARARDPILLTEVESALEARGDTEALVELYERRLEDGRLDPSFEAFLYVQLGALYEAQGRPRQAIDALEHAFELDAEATLAGRVALVRLHRSLGDETAYQIAMMSLSQSLPAGPLRATCLRRLATHLEDVGHIEAAAVNYEAVLHAHPTDPLSLAALERILPALGEDDRLIDPLMRALFAESDPQRRAVLGSHLAVRLIVQGRWAPARDAVDQILSTDPTQVEALMLSAELHEAEADWDGALSSLETLLLHVDDDAIRVEAIRRAVHAAVHSGDVERAEEIARSLGAAVDTPGLDAFIDVYSMLKQWDRVAPALRERMDRTADPDERTAFQLRLARVQEEHLNDPKAALATLSDTQVSTEQTATVEQVLRLGERTGRWDLAAEALENALASGQLEKTFELAVRRRLAALLEGPLERPDQALAHFRRILKLDPTASVRERLARLADDPRKAIEHLRVLLSQRPDDAERYRELRLRFLDAGIEDGAFCAEAVLIGLGAANEEEEYFYRRRRARLLRQLPAEPLSSEERASLFANHPVVQALAALSPVLGEVFPVDLAAYGLDEAVPAGKDGDLVRAVARLFDVRLHVLSIPGRLAPATEPGLWMRGETRPAVLLPDGTGQFVRREQLFLAGVLAGRVAVHGVLFDASRIAPTTEREIAYLVDAARVVFMDATPRFEGAVFDDLRTRLMRANIHRDAVIEALESLDTELDLSGAAQLLDVAAARCGILAAVDPAIAIQGLRDHATLFARGPLDAVRAIPYAVSEAHLAIRKRLRVFR